MLKGKKIRELASHPNALTMYRVVAVPGIVILMLFPSRLSCLIAAILFSAAAITDFFDGFLARQRGLVSSFGKIMDPLADKVLVSSALIMLAAYGWAPAWVVCVIIGRELAVTGLRNVMIENQIDVGASSLGKYKTGFQIAAIIPLLAHYTWLGIDMHAIGSLYLWVALVMTIWSGADYFIRFRKLFVG
jgi:CDP-diacylglycerol---glycerol-3-phosphate 3-phosphatidyltransferase